MAMSRRTLHGVGCISPVWRTIAIREQSDDFVVIRIEKQISYSIPIRSVHR
jgi:hypothetical protein